MGLKGPQANTAEQAEKFKFKQYQETAPLSPVPQVGGSGTLNPLRRWPFNMQEALCLSNASGTLEPTRFSFGSNQQADASAVELFIFSEATPIILSARHEIGPFYVNGVQAAMHYPTTAIDAPIYQIEQVGDYNAVPTLVTKGDGSPYTATDLIGAGAALHAAVAGSGVRVKGFPFIVGRPLPAAGGTWSYVSAPGVNTTISAFTRTAIFYQCLSASPNGFVPFSGASDLSGIVQKALVPVVLRSDDYTAAIRDNKNLIETASQNFRVVGIYKAI